jgi:uncharacterized membrane protein YcaP (DUF421 family)
MVRFLYSHPLLTRLIEGKSDVLISHGKVNHKKLQQEGITLQELEVAAHHQGFVSLGAIEKAIIESSGAITFIAKTPTDETSRHLELIQRIEQLSEDVKLLQKK